MCGKVKAKTHDNYCHVANIPIPAANIIIAAVQPTQLVNRPFTLLPIIFLLLETIMMRTSRGGARTPLMTAVQKSAAIGLIPIKLISAPIKVEIAITA